MDTTHLKPNGSRRRRLTEDAALRAVEAWRQALGVRQTILLDRISYRQVTDHTGRRGCGLVGVSYDHEHGYIYHTRALTVEDIVHELLHVAHPDWSEQEVVAETDRLLTCERRSNRRRAVAGEEGAATPAILGIESPCPDGCQPEGEWPRSTRGDGQPQATGTLSES
jgi:hypothetical protein